MTNLKVENIAIGHIRPYAKNAKEHPEKQIQQIAASIEEYGFTNPIIIDETREIIAGHGRYLAAQLLKLSEVPTIMLSHLSDMQKRGYRLADNKIAENGGWSTEILKLELEEIQIMADFDIQNTGFSTLEVDILLNEKPTKAVNEKENAVPFVPDDEIVSKLGDLWLLGKHRLLCGSSLEEAHFERLMDGKLADLISTDSPYNLSSKTIGNSGKTKHADFAMAAGELSREGFTKFLTDNFKLCSKFAKPTALAYEFMDFRHIREIMDAGESAFGPLINLCIWSKPQGGMGSFYRSQYEMCFVFANNPDRKYLNNIELGKHGRYRTNIWQYGSVGGFGHHKDDLKFHSTVKPYEMIKDILLDASPRGGIVLDPFMGSGTSIIAAEKAKRVCYGIELDPRYIDTAIRRFKDLFGIDAIHEQSGKTYSELLAQKQEVA